MTEQWERMITHCGEGDIGTEFNMYNGIYEGDERFDFGGTDAGIVVGFGCWFGVGSKEC